MATLRIDCVDSIGFVSRFYEGTEDAEMLGEVCGVDDDETAGYNPVYQVGYHKGTLEISYGVGPRSAYFLFEEQNLDFLKTSNVISAKLFVTSGRELTRLIIFKTLTLRPEIRAGYHLHTPIDEPYYVKPAHLMPISAYYEGNQFYSINSVSTEEVITIDLTNAIDTIQAISNYGFKIETTGGGVYTLWYGIMAASNLRPYIEIEYEVPDTSPKASPLSPVSAIVDGDHPITLSWSYTHPQNVPQSHFQIQQYVNNEWVDIIAKTAGSQNSYTAPANTFSPGQGQWRVMVWCQDGTYASEWSSPAYIIVRTKPQTPTITSAGTSPSPTFEWQSSQQQGYEISLGNYFSQISYGEARKWTYPGILPNGNVTFSIRIQTAQGLWSDWATTTIYVQNIPTGNVTLSGKQTANCAQLSWTQENVTSNQFNIYRDGNLIAQTPNTTFIDCYSNGLHTYQVYAILENGNYTASNEEIIDVALQSTVISALAPISWVKLKLRSRERPTYEKSVSAQTSFVHYQGRTLPVAYRTDFIDNAYTFTFSTTEETAIETLSKLCGNIVIIKTSDRSRLFGVITGITFSRKNRLTDFSLTITESDVSEVEINAQNIIKIPLDEE